MFEERLAEIRHHCPVEMRGRHAAELVKALKLEDDGHELHCRVERASRAHVALASVETLWQQVVERNGQAVVEANGIFVEVMYVDLVVLVVSASQVWHAMVERVLLLIHVGGLSRASTTWILVDVCVLVDHVFGHQLVLVGFLHALFALQLVLVAILAIGYHGACLAFLGKHLHYGVLDVFYLEDVCRRKIFLLAQCKHLVGVFAWYFIDVALVTYGLEVFQNGDLNLCQVERNYLAVALSNLDHGCLVIFFMHKNGKLFLNLRNKSFPFWITLCFLLFPEVVCFCSFPIAKVVKSLISRRCFIFFFPTFLFSFGNQ